MYCNAIKGKTQKIVFNSHDIAQSTKRGGRIISKVKNFEKSFWTDFNINIWQSIPINLELTSTLTTYFNSDINS